MPMPHAVDRSPPRIPGNAGSPRRGAPIGRGRLGVLAIGLLLASLAGGGCRSGVRSMTAPKWPSFGSSKPKGIDDTSLTAAPKIDASTTKPSAAATPYPTTSTPAGYVVNEASPTAGAGAPGIQTAATDPAMVTYGVTPHPQLAQPAPQAAPALAEVAPPAAISPQVGPYATLPPPPPAAETPAGDPSGGRLVIQGNPPPGFQAGAYDVVPPPPSPAQVAGPPGGGFPAAPPASTSAFPSTAGYEPSRVADARGSVAAEAAAPGLAAPAVAAAAPLAPINPPESGTPARYASDRSRYGDPLAADPAPAAPASAYQAPPAADAGWAGAGFAGSGALAPAAAAPAVASPPAPFPTAPPAALPAANPDGLTSPPVRRPDPVFRPGGTSSYRPAEQIFVDEQPVAPSAVRTASFETVAPPLPAGQD